MNTHKLAFTAAVVVLLSGCAPVSASSISTPGPTEAWLVAAGPCALLVEPASRIENAFRDALASRISDHEFGRQMSLGAEELRAVSLPPTIQDTIVQPLAALKTLVSDSTAVSSIAPEQQQSWWAALEPITLACRAAGGDLPLRVKNGSEG